MSAGNEIPAKVLGYNVYVEGNQLAGVADVELPDLEAMSDTIKGAGIAGEIDLPSIGQFGPMAIKLNFKSMTRAAAALAQPRFHAIDCRCGVQVLDSGSGTQRIGAVRVSVRAMPKKVGLGKLEPNSGMESSLEFECSYFALYIDGAKMIEIDKLNSVCVVNENDQLTDLRSALGVV